MRNRGLEWKILPPRQQFFRRHWLCIHKTLHDVAAHAVQLRQDKAGRGGDRLMNKSVIRNVIVKISL